MMLNELGHDPVAAETSYRLERLRHSYDDRGRGRRSALRAAASRLWALRHRSDSEPTWPAGVSRPSSALSHHSAAH